MPDLTLEEALEFANSVTHAFVNAPHVLTDPMFIARLVLAGAAVAAAKDDEDRRGIVQAEILKLEREFQMSKSLLLLPLILLASCAPTLSAVQGTASHLTATSRQP